MGKRATVAIVLALLGLAGFAAQSAGAAERVDLARACWPAEALAQRPGEKTVRRDPAARGGPPAVEQAPTVPVDANRRGAIRRVELPPGRKLVALTFDFCEQPGEVAGYDGAIIDILRAANVRATLFFGGRWMTTHADRARQLIADPRFEIASHGWAHRNVRLLSGRALTEEITGPSAAYAVRRQELGRMQCAAPHLISVPARITLTRFPFGACNAAALQATAEAGLLAIQWDVSTGDPSPGQSAAAIADVIVRQTRPGSIILGHANGRGHHTAEALPGAIDRLKARGFEFVTVSELLAAGRPVVTDTCYDAKPGDTDKYDFFDGAQAARTERRNGWTPTTVPR